MKTFDDLLLAYTGRDAAYHERAQTTGLDFARHVYAAMSAALAEQHRECGEAIASADHAIRLFVKLCGLDDARPGDVLPWQFDEIARDNSEDMRELARAAIAKAEKGGAA